MLFEGRDAAGKGGVIKRITESLNPRVCRIVALGTPTERERSQWYFQRYVQHLPAAGEIVLFDRSWYNRAGVEHVMGFCTDEEYWEFLRACPLFEEMLVRSGIYLIKYWFSVNDEEQERRFVERMHNPIKRWKLSPMDLEARKYWVEYSKAKDVMLEYTDRKQTPWYIVDADNKKTRAAKLHPAPAAPDPVQGPAAGRARAAAAPAGHRLQAAEEVEAELGAGRLLKGRVPSCEAVPRPRPRRAPARDLRPPRV